MINETGTHLEGERLTSGSNNVRISSASNLNDVLDFFNIKVISDGSIEEFFNIYLKPSLIAVKDKKLELDGAYFIHVENNRGGRNRDEFGGIDDALEILSRTPETKIVLIGMTPEKMLRESKKEANFVMAHANVVFVDILNLPKGVANLKFKGDVNEEQFLTHADERSKQKILKIRHSLQGVVDPYHPQNDDEKYRVENALKQAKEYFPGLDTIDKMLDFVLHINIDLPEKMKGQRIEGVYCDVDGTLIEYVGIYSGKEGTQSLKQPVVDLLKKYEKEGKQIFIWTGGDVSKKEAYLRSLGITWPVLNKYDYAGATAEIVVDDTDQNAFIVQSKIYPETYIDVKDIS